MSYEIHQHTSDCPRCGAPIFAVTKTPILHAPPPTEVTEVEERNAVVRGYVVPLTSKEPPSVHFTCDCRHTLPKPLPDVSELTPESTDDADRKWLARNRGERTVASAERVEE